MIQTIQLVDLYTMKVKVGQRLSNSILRAKIIRMESVLPECPSVRLSSCVLIGRCTYKIESDGGALLQLR